MRETENRPKGYGRARGNLCAGRASGPRTAGFTACSTHNGEDCFDKVGEKDRYGAETILVMLETDSVYLCCTANRGVRRGEPILTGKGEDTFVTNFDPDEGQDADVPAGTEEGA